MCEISSSTVGIESISSNLQLENGLTTSEHIVQPKEIEPLLSQSPAEVSFNPNPPGKIYIQTIVHL